MMWKESYRIGIEAIDEQHKELFRMAGQLVQAIEDGAGHEQFEQAITFLKDYVVKHFHDEEVYQETISYPGIKEHKEAHRKFASAVLDYEQKLIASNYDIRIVKDLMGTLTAWLVYHVADTDQRMARGESVQNTTIQTAGNTFPSVFSASLLNVLESMTGAEGSTEKNEVKDNNALEGDIFIKIGLAGDKKGMAFFAFSQEFARELVYTMTTIQPEKMDEFVCSALAEFANITCGNAVTAMSLNGIQCDITTPSVIEAQELPGQHTKVMAIDTNIGKLEISIELQ